MVPRLMCDLILMCLIVGLNSERNHEIRVSEVSALYDHETGAAIYKDPALSACFIQESDGNGEAETLTRLPGDNNTTNLSSVKLLSQFQKEFCGSFPVFKLGIEAPLLLESFPVKLKRVHRDRKRRSAAGGSNYASPYGNPVSHNWQAQAQVQGSLAGQGFFSGQAQSAAGGMSQSQIQMGGGLIGSISSGAGGVQAALSLGSRTGSGQISSSGMGPSNSQLQLNLGEHSESTNARANVVQHSHASSFNNEYTGTRMQQVPTHTQKYTPTLGSSHQPQPQQYMQYSRPPSFPTSQSQNGHHHTENGYPIAENSRAQQYRSSNGNMIQQSSRTEERPGAQHRQYGVDSRSDGNFQYPHHMNGGRGQELSSQHRGTTGSSDLSHSRRESGFQGTSSMGPVHGQQYPGTYISAPGGQAQFQSVVLQNNDRTYQNGAPPIQQPSLHTGFQAHGGLPNYMQHQHFAIPNGPIPNGISHGPVQQHARIPQGQPLTNGARVYIPSVNGVSTQVQQHAGQGQTQNEAVHGGLQSHVQNEVPPTQRPNFHTGFQVLNEHPGYMQHQHVGIPHGQIPNGISHSHGPVQQHRARIPNLKTHDQSLTNGAGVNIPTVNGVSTQAQQHGRSQNEVLYRGLQSHVQNGASPVQTQNGGSQAQEHPQARGDPHTHTQGQGYTSPQKGYANGHVQYPSRIPANQFPNYGQPSPSAQESPTNTNHNRYPVPLPIYPIQQQSSTGQQIQQSIPLQGQTGPSIQHQSAQNVHPGTQVQAPSNGNGNTQNQGRCHVVTFTCTLIMDTNTNGRSKLCRPKVQRNGAGHGQPNNGQGICCC